MAGRATSEIMHKDPFHTWYWTHQEREVFFHEELERTKLYSYVAQHNIYIYTAVAWQRPAMANLAPHYSQELEE